MDIGLTAPLFIVGLICAVFGWGVVHLSSRIERRRTERHIEEYGDHDTYPVTKSSVEKSTRLTCRERPHRNEHAPVRGSLRRYTCVHAIKDAAAECTFVLCAVSKRARERLRSADRPLCGTNGDRRPATARRPSTPPSPDQSLCVGYCGLLNRGRGP